MARLEDLIADVEDATLREAIAHEVRTLKRRTRFGLVFERHLPERVLLSTGNLVVGELVRLRDAPADERELRVLRRDGERAVIVDADGMQSEHPVADLLALKDFGDVVFPALVPIGEVERAPDRPWNVAIDGENYHALQALLYAWEGEVDCIYIDPPYNTGARDWVYNNDYVDSSDTYRHSKWLSFMEKRLKLAKRLLSPDGVLVVTIDEHEVHHLGVLVERLFAEYERQLVTIVNNPKGVTRPQGGLSRVEEHALVCFPSGSVLEGRGDDLLTPLRTKGEDTLAVAGKPPRWQGLLHSGEDHRRQDRPSMFYPVLIDPERSAVVGAGEPLLPVERKNGELDWVEPDLDAEVDGCTAVWPVRKDGSWGRWYVGAETLRGFVEKGYVRLGGYDERRKTWALQYPFRALREQIADGRVEVVEHDEVRNVVELRYATEPTRRIKTVWHRSRHDAGSYGSDLLGAFLGERRFAFPKSLYAVRDTLAAIVGAKPEAKIVDFFAGSATTLHATALLNAEDSGVRQCVVVTNNEVDEERRRELLRRGLRPGDPEWEAHGIFQAVARPRIEAALSGMRADGEPVEGAYLDGRPYAQGFEENCQFLKLEYLLPDDIELGRAFQLLHPLLWLTAGARAAREAVDDSAPYVMSGAGGYAVLFDERALPELLAALQEAEAVRHVFVVTDSDDAFSEVTEALGPGYVTQMLYKDYLRNFRAETARTS